MKKVLSLVIVLFLINPIHTYSSMLIDNKMEVTYKSKRFTNIESMAYVWNYFKNQGIDENIIAGVMGNISIESNFNSSIKSKSGHAGYV